MIPRLDLVPAFALPAPSAPLPLAGRLAEIAGRLAAWRRRVRVAQRFRGFDRHQLRDLGLNPLDQW
jgi:uncharacterized protein YjiS (DUF1127 family)